MGSFNKKGFISNIPIEYGERCSLIFMKFNQFEMSGNTYPTDMLMPYFLPIFGTYDDYGRIKNIEHNKITDHIESFFGEDIELIIHKMDDNCVGRGNKHHVKKNDQLFQQLTFGIEHARIYDKLSKMFTPAIKERFHADFFLDHFGFKQDEDKKDIWENKKFGMKIMLDWDIQEISTGKVFYSPYELAKHIIKIGYTLPELYENASSAQLALLETNRLIEEFENLSYKEKLTRMFNPYNEKYMGLISKYITNTCIDGDIIMSHTSRHLPAEFIKTINDQDIIDFANFHMNMKHMNLSYIPSNYGNQSYDIEKYYSLNREIKNIIVEKVNRELEKCDEEEVEIFESLSQQIKKDDRSDKIQSILR